MKQEPAAIIAGRALRSLIKKYYKSQQAFAEDSGYDLRAVNRYINRGINSLATVEELARFFSMDIIAFLQVGLKGTE